MPSKLRPPPKVMENSYQKFTKDVATIGVTGLILALRALILLPIISKMLGPSAYGIWTQVMVTLALAEPVFELGLTNALVRFLAAEKNREEIQEGFYSVLCIMVAAGVVIALIIFSLAEPISNALFGGSGTTTVRLAALVVPFSALHMACSRYFLCFRQINAFNILDLTRYLGEIGLAAGAVLLGYGVNGAVISLTIAAAVTGLVALAIIVSQIGVKRPNLRYLKPYLKFGLPILPTMLAYWVTQSSDRYIIGSFRGTRAVGIYAVGYAAGSILSIIQTPVLRALSPTLSKYYSEGKIDDVKIYLMYSLKYTLMLGIPAAVGLSLLGRQILTIFTTAEFALEGYLVIPFVAASMLLAQVYGVMGTEVLKLVKKTHILAIAWSASALSSLGLNLAFVPRYGILAAAGVTLFAYALATGITLYFSCREITIRVDTVSIAKSLAASGVMAGVILAISPAKIWEGLLTIAAGVIVYGIVLWLLKGLTRTELGFFRGLITRNLSLIKNRGQNIKK